MECQAAMFRKAVEVTHSAKARLIEVASLNSAADFPSSQLSASLQVPTPLPVYVFALMGGGTGTIAYAWSCSVGGRQRVFTALHLGAIRTAADAVRVTLELAPAAIQSETETAVSVRGSRPFRAWVTYLFERASWRS